MTTNVTIKLTLDTNTPTPNEIQNAVRRALSQPTVKDMPLTPALPLATKGVAVKVRAVKRATPHRNPEIQAIREFGRTNGFAVGQRGRISKELREAFANQSR